jgi:hypothetical protein
MRGTLGYKVATKCKSKFVVGKIMKIGLVLFCLLATGMFQAEKTNDEVSPEEYAVYSAYLDDINKSPQRGPAVKLAVIDAQTQSADTSCSPENIAKFDKRVSNARLKPLFDNFRAKSQSQKPLGKSFNIKYAYVILNSKDFEAFFKTNDFDGWKDFYKKYPNSPGFTTFSRVGFNSNKTKASIFKNSICGPLCGSGDYVVFEKVADKWKIVSYLNCWVS